MTRYVVVLETRNYIVGEANAPSGLYRSVDGGPWTHLGWTNVRCFGLGLSARSNETLFLACGNGVLRSQDQGNTWRVMTDWRITEVLAVVSAYQTNHVCAATAHGVWESTDGGDTWEPRQAGLTVPNDTFTTSIQMHRVLRNTLWIGTESGLFVATDGKPWKPMGPRVPIRALEQHPQEPACWAMGTEDHGVWVTGDNGATWQQVDGVPAKATIYALAFDPTNAKRVVAAGYRTGLWISEDSGLTWGHQVLDLPAHAIHALAFDSEDSTCLWIGTVGAGVYTTHSLGQTCTHAGLPEATIYGFEFTGAVR